MRVQQCRPTRYLLTLARSGPLVAQLHAHLPRQRRLLVTLLLVIEPVAAVLGAADHLHDNKQKSEWETRGRRSGE